jgi:hypothetical protein
MPAQYLIRLAQLANLTFEGFDPIPFFSGHAIAHSAVLLGLPDPFAQRLGNKASGECSRS